MKQTVTTRTQQILRILHILAWVAFFGLVVKIGGVLVSYLASLVNPAAARNLYGGLQLETLADTNFWYYSQYVSLFVFALVLQAYVWWLVAGILSHLRLSNPFTFEVAKRLERVSFVLFTTWVVALVGAGHAKWLLKVTGETYVTISSGEWIFMAGLVFVISQIFKRGMELQSENELTV